MSLYPIVSLDPAVAVIGNNPLPSGSLVCIPINMTTVQMTQIVLAQLSLTQDYSMRTWMSLFPDGIPLAPGVFPVMRNGLPFVIHLASHTPPAPSYAILVEPGAYVLNILNLTNEMNVYSFSKSDLA